MIDLGLLKLRVDRWLCRVFGHKPEGSSSSATVIPIRVLCVRCGEQVRVVNR